jgi:hypothetical protein
MLRTWLIRALPVVALWCAASALLPLSGAAYAQAADPEHGLPLVTANPACGAVTDNYFGFTDDQDAPSAWTYANGSQWCVRVDWYVTPPPRGEDCRLQFYVPVGNATADLAVGLFDAAGNEIIARVQEDGASGYVNLIDSTPYTNIPINHVNIGDNNGQAYPTRIGWGTFPGSVAWVRPPEQGGGYCSTPAFLK